VNTTTDPASSFVAEAAASIAPTGPSERRALDVAAGKGWHALLLARMGWRVFAVDRDLGALRSANEKAAREQLRLCVWCADLTEAPLPEAAFELVVVTRYLQRDLFASLRRTVVPGGVIVYETFTDAQRTLGRGPTSPDHLLEAGELRARFQTFEILFYEEVEGPDAVARLVAKRRV
jgi:SAM-dependent methyltransferase